MLVFMFPGQSSRYPAMLERVIDAWPASEAVIEQASRVLGRDLRAHYRSGNETAFRSNRDVQVGVFLTSCLYQQALADLGVTGDLSLGLSLGEYNHLVHIGAVGFEDALRLVDARGRAYDAGPDGMMASIFPLPFEDLTGYLDAARAHGEVYAANINSPSQTVIAGSRAAVEAAIRLIEDGEPGVAAVVIEQRVPMHTPLFRRVADAFLPELRGTRWLPPRLPYIPNVEGALLTVPGPEQIVELLARHVYSPVQWRRSIEAIVARHPDARFVEVGPGQVLCNLMQRRWLANRRYATDHEDAGARIVAAARGIADAA